MKKKNLLDEIIEDREDICNLYTRSNDAKQEIINIQRTLKLHGEAHMAQDLLPQFRELCKKVEKLEGVLNYKLNDGPIMNHSKRIADLERHNLPALVDSHIKRLADHDESIEALSETVDQLSTYKYEAGAGMLKRIDALEMRLSRAQDMIAECHPSGYLTVKNISPKKPAAPGKKAK